MSAFVVLSLVLVVAVLGVLGVVAVHLLRTLASLRSAMRAAAERLAPLADELQAESAVTGLETAALQRSLAELRSARSDRRGIPRTYNSAKPPLERVQ